MDEPDVKFDLICPERVTIGDDFEIQVGVDESEVICPDILLLYLSSHRWLEVALFAENQWTKLPPTLLSEICECSHGPVS